MRYTVFMRGRISFRSTAILHDMILAVQWVGLNPHDATKICWVCCVSVADLEICRDKSLLVQGPGPLSGYKLDRSVVVPSTTVYQLPAFETPNCFENSAALLAVFFEGMASDLIGSSRLLADMQLATKRRRVKP